MLILVGVTVATISDGGLFKKAKTAAGQTEEKAIYEQLVGAMKLGKDGKIDVKTTGDDALEVLQKQYGTEKVKNLKDTDTLRTVEVEANNGKKYTYTITPKEIITGEHKFYKYAYIYDNNGDKQEFYFMENGFMVSFYNGMTAIAIPYEKTGNNLQSADGMSFVLTSDCSAITVEGADVTLARDDNKLLTFNSIPDETYKIYKNAVYLSESTQECFFTQYYVDETEQFYVLYWSEIKNDYEDYELSEFVDIDGTEISSDGKTVLYNGVTYRLLEQ